MPDVALADNPGVVARPPRLFLGFLLAGFALDMLWPWPVLPQVVQLAAGLPLLAAGSFIMAAAVRQFGRAGTSIPTLLPARTLVTCGVYRYTRNPMYLAMALLYLGLAVFFDSLWPLLLLPILLAVVHWGVVLREERYMADKFGIAYQRYRDRVSRWF